MTLCSARSPWGLGVAAMFLLVSMQGCVTEATSLRSPQDDGPKVLLVGKVVTLLTGERGRKFAPAVTEIELAEQDAGTRYRIPVDGAHEQFAVFLPPGRYEIIRVKIHEGPFLSMAVLDSSFVVEDVPIMFVGTWRFGVESPKYGRMLFVSMTLDDKGRQQVETDIRETYPGLLSTSMVTAIPVPAELQSRLYEVAPYPRISRYFRRHYW
ncbi:MAG: hypothetical protein JSR62_10530 [Nitrospira sp.]|nr:hypothetical protein [Nitrospira sp.]